MDFYFVAANSNALSGTFLDPVSKIPDYKVCAVKIEKAGAAALTGNAA
jgi:formate dehydrogenase alpha subunit